MPLIIRVEQGDITAFTGDAIVNAANNHLQLGAGVAGAIARKAGPAVQAECDQWIERNGPLSVGGAAITGAGDLPVAWIVHAAAMGDAPATERSIRSATLAALRLARQHEIESIAFPVLGTGVGSFPFDRAAGAMFDEVRGFGADDDSPSLVVFYGYTEEDARRLTALMSGEVGH
jgi:O-acetyl-ADP-ribose deacetylase (regulator of RNase III)